MDEAIVTEVRAENVELYCGICEEITELGTMEGADLREYVKCGSCGERYTVRLAVEA